MKNRKEGRQETRWKRRMKSGTEEWKEPEPRNKGDDPGIIVIFVDKANIHPCIGLPTWASVVAIPWIPPPYPR